MAKFSRSIFVQLKYFVWFYLACTPKISIICPIKPTMSQSEENIMKSNFVSNFGNVHSPDVHANLYWSFHRNSMQWAIYQQCQHFENLPILIMIYQRKLQQLMQTHNATQIAKLGKFSRLAFMQKTKSLNMFSNLH